MRMMELILKHQKGTMKDQEFTMSLLFRTQTGEESLKESLLSVITASDNVTLEVLDEAFCRDVEAFSEAFQVHIDADDDI